MILTAALFAAGCSDDKPTSGNPPANTSTTTWNSAGYWETTDLNASSTEDYIFYSFARRDTVTLTFDQAMNSADWDIGFRRVSILINSGVSGAANTRALDLTAAGEVDTAGFVNLINLLGVDTTGLESGSYSLAIDEWYSYNPVTHQFNLTNYVYMSTDAAGGFVKFQVIGMENPGFPPDMGTISIRYIYSTDRSFDEAPDTLVFDASSGGPFYVDFSSGALANPANPRASTDWDLEIENYEIHQNNTIFGPGEMGTYEVWQDQDDPTDFDETASMPDMAPPFPDDFGSPLTDWYDYIHEPGGTPTVLSKGNIYLAIDGSWACKFQIMTYYNLYSGLSGWDSFRCRELE